MSFNGSQDVWDKVTPKSLQPKINSIRNSKKPKDSVVEHDDNSDVDGNLDVNSDVDDNSDIDEVNTGSHIPNEEESKELSDNELTEEEISNYLEKLAKAAITTEFTQYGGVQFGISKLFFFNNADKRDYKFKISEGLLYSCPTINGRKSDVEGSATVDSSIKITTPTSKTWSIKYSGNQSDSNPLEINLKEFGVAVSGDLPKNLTFTTPTSTIAIELTTSLTEGKDLAREKRDIGLNSEQSKLANDMADFLRHVDDSRISWSYCKNMRRRMLLSANWGAVYSTDDDAIYQVMQDTKFLLAKIIYESFMEKTDCIDSQFADQTRDDKCLRGIWRVRITEDDSDNTKLSIRIIT